MGDGEAFEPGQAEREAKERRTADDWANLPLVPSPPGLRSFEMKTPLPEAKWRMVNGGGPERTEVTVDDMKDRVARALVKHFRGGGSIPEITLEQGAILFRDAAGAVVEAMREPTAAMVKIGRATPVSHSWGRDGEFIADPDQIWQAMVDEALK